MSTHLSLSPNFGLGPARTSGYVQGLWLPAPSGLIERTLLALRSVAQDHPGQHAQPTSGPGGSSGSGGAVATPDTPDEPLISMEQLVRDHADAVYRVALSVTKNPTMAEDVSQDALIKAWQSLPSYRGDAPLRHWILRITHNTAISMLRRRREEVVAPFDLPDRPATDAAVDIQVQDRLAIDRFEVALGDLDGISRSIVVLREVEGLTYAEMSDVLELPLPTIRTRLLRARRQLADALDGWQP